MQQEGRKDRLNENLESSSADYYIWKQVSSLQKPIKPCRMQWSEFFSVAIRSIVPNLKKKQRESPLSFSTNFIFLITEGTHTKEAMNETGKKNEPEMIDFSEEEEEEELESFRNQDRTFRIKERERWNWELNPIQSNPIDYDISRLF